MMKNKLIELWQEFRLVFSGRNNTIDTILPPIVFALVDAFAGLRPDDGIAHPSHATFAIVQSFGIDAVILRVEIERRQQRVAGRHRRGASLSEVTAIKGAGRVAALALGVAVAGQVHHLAQRFVPAGQMVVERNGDPVEVDRRALTGCLLYTI